MLGIRPQFVSPMEHHVWRFRDTQFWGILLKIKYISHFTTFPRFAKSYFPFSSHFHHSRCVLYVICPFAVLGDDEDTEGSIEGCIVTICPLVFALCFRDSDSTKDSFSLIKAGTVAFIY